ncbi:MAG: exosome complex RNA-binding protein Csl4 [Thermoplasmata archaeon]
MEGKLVLPGDYLGNIEEFIPGHFVMEENGKLYSKIVGIAKIDRNNMTINIHPLNPVPELKPRQIVYGVVNELFTEFALVSVVWIENEKRAIVGSKQDGVIHISKIQQEFVDDIGKMFRIGDIVRARVIKSKPSLQLSTAEPELGVIKALCMKCRNQLIKRDSVLYCERCNRIETRKTSTLYGNIKIKLLDRDMGDN